jgi:predicted acyl esterase
MRMFAITIAVTAAPFLSAQTEVPTIQLNFQEIMIPMRDGVRLQTVILSPKNPKGSLPFLIRRQRRIG